MSELPLATRLFVKAYRWRRVDPVPWASLRRPLREAKIALVSTAGLVLPGQEPFDDDLKGGDWSFREVPSDADVHTMRDTHRSGSFDHSGVQADPNLAFPLDRLRELVAEGTIGSVNQRHFSMMGSITLPQRLCEESAPAVASMLEADGVDAVLLIPI
ncbi:MAG TPA: glycine/sarcosine/betaine reductase selenoprotein B family protein [Thermoanaerobaculia bacterium]|nr:glycine/sarcosine/betaine reductase selenoprotein B family protein [Thermoanaerobaculia bacterium]